MTDHEAQGSTLPRWAHRDAEGLVLTLVCRSVSTRVGCIGSIMVVLGVIAPIGAAFSAPAEPVFWPGALVILTVALWLGVRLARASRVKREHRIRLTSEALIVGDRQWPRAEVTASARRPERGLFRLVVPRSLGLFDTHITLRGGSERLELAGVGIADHGSAWLVSAVDAWREEQPLPTWTLAPPSPAHLGTVAPGQRTVGLGKPPLTLGAGVIYGAAVLVSASIWFVVDPVAEPTAMQAALALGFSVPVLVLPVVFLVYRARKTTIELRQGALTLWRGRRSTTLAYADLRSVQRVRRAVHHEVVLHEVGGRRHVLRMGTRALADALMAAIEEARAVDVAPDANDEAARAAVHRLTRRSEPA